MNDMDHALIDEDRWADRYVLGRLTAEEQQRFEEHFVGCPKCLDELEAVEGLRGSLRELPAGEAAPAPTRSPSFALAPWLLAAASLVLAVGLSALFYADLRHARQELADSRGRTARLEQLETRLQEDLRKTTEAEAPSAASVFTLNLTRGVETAQPENWIVLPKPSARIVLLFDRPPGPPETSYSVRLFGADGRPIGEAVRLAPSAEETLALSLPSGLLGAGDYVLTVDRGAPAESPLATYRFRLVPAR